MKAPTNRDVPADSPLTANAEFRNPHSILNRLARLMWNIVWILFYRWTPPRLGAPWRRLILRCFGARIGRTWIHPSTRIWAPWRLQCGDDVFIDRGCNLYNAFGISVGNRVVISMECFLCTASHDYSKVDFPLIGAPIVVGSDCWIAAQSFLMPGIQIGHGSVVGARSVVTKDVCELGVVAGNPARFICTRKISRDTSLGTGGPQNGTVS